MFTMCQKSSVVMKKFYFVIDSMLNLYLGKIISIEPCLVNSRQLLFGEVLLAKTLKQKEFEEMPNRDNLIKLFFSLLRENKNLFEFIRITSIKTVLFVLWSSWNKEN